MNGYSIYKKAILRLGYNDAENSRLTDRAAEFLNQILTDLNLENTTGLLCELSLSEEVCDTVVSGLAMLLALSEGDGERNELFAGIYNAKRGKLLSLGEERKDVLPLPCLYGGN